MSKEACPQCQGRFNDTNCRPVQEACGHIKCRTCFIGNIDRCRQCRSTESYRRNTYISSIGTGRRRRGLPEAKVEELDLDLMPPHLTPEEPLHLDLGLSSREQLTVTSTQELPPLLFSVVTKPPSSKKSLKRKPSKECIPLLLKPAKMQTPLTGGRSVLKIMKQPYPKERLSPKYSPRSNINNSSKLDQMGSSFLKPPRLFRQVSQEDKECNSGNIEISKPVKRRKSQSQTNKHSTIIPTTTHNISTTTTPHWSTQYQQQQKLTLLSKLRSLAYSRSKAAAFTLKKPSSNSESKRKELSTPRSRITPTIPLLSPYKIAAKGELTRPLCGKMSICKSAGTLPDRVPYVSSSCKGSNLNGGEIYESLVIKAVKTDLNSSGALPMEENRAYINSTVETTTTLNDVLAFDPTEDTSLKAMCTAVDSTEDKTLKGLGCNFNSVVDKSLLPKRKKRQPFIIRDHISILTGETPMYQCDVCMKKFKTRAHIRYHEFCQNGEKPYKCDVCGQRFVTKSHYEYHMRTHTGEQPFVCPKCGKGFNQRGKVNRHLRSHTGEKPFICKQWCGRGFSNAQALQCHYLIHTGERPYACQYCTKRFTGMTNLKKHVITHTGERPYACTHCGKCFGLKWTLDLHLRTHSPDRAFGCNQCPKAFSNSKDLRRHLVIHSDERPFKCSICGSTFRRKDNLDRHVKSTHCQTTECKDEALSDVDSSQKNDASEQEIQDENNRDADPVTVVPRFGDVREKQVDELSNVSDSDLVIDIDYCEERKGSPHYNENTNSVESSGPEGNDEVILGSSEVSLNDDFHASSKIQDSKSFISVQDIFDTEFPACSLQEEVIICNDMESMLTDKNEPFDDDNSLDHGVQKLTLTYNMDIECPQVSLVPGRAKGGLNETRSNIQPEELRSQQLFPDSFFGNGYDFKVETCQFATRAQVEDEESITSRDYEDSFCKAEECQASKSHPCESNDSHSEPKPTAFPRDYNVSVVEDTNKGSPEVAQDSTCNPLQSNSAISSQALPLSQRLSICQSSSKPLSSSKSSSAQQNSCVKNRSFLYSPEFHIKSNVSSQPSFRFVYGNGVPATESSDTNMNIVYACAAARAELSSGDSNGLKLNLLYAEAVGMSRPDDSGTVQLVYTSTVPDQKVVHSPNQNVQIYSPTLITAEKNAHADEIQALIAQQSRLKKESITPLPVELVYTCNGTVLVQTVGEPQDLNWLRNGTNLSFLPYLEPGQQVSTQQYQYTKHSTGYAVNTRVCVNPESTREIVNNFSSKLSSRAVYDSDIERNTCEAANAFGLQTLAQAAAARMLNIHRDVDAITTRPTEGQPLEFN